MSVTGLVGNYAKLSSRRSWGSVDDDITHGVIVSMRESAGCPIVSSKQQPGWNRDMGEHHTLNFARPDKT